MAHHSITPQDFCTVISRSLSLDISSLPAESVRVYLSELAAISSWAESTRILLTRRLQDLSRSSAAVVPADILAATHGTTRADAKKNIARVATLDLVPQLETALHSGVVSVAHVDAVTQAFAQLEDHERQKVAARGDWINMVASHSTPDNFSRAVRHAVRQLNDDEGLSVLERQRKRTYLRHWVDRDSGMVCLRGEFDPESGLRIVGKLQSTLERMFRGYTVDGQVRTPDHLRALTLFALVGDGSIEIGNTHNSSAGTAPPGSASSTGGTEQSNSSVVSIHSGSTRAEISVIIDLHTLQNGLHKNSIMHTGTDVELPVETIRRMACEAKIIPIVLDGSGVVLDLGRSTRLASRHQRRALEAMYATCAIPNCFVPVGQCQPHHINYWNRGGSTDMINLVPLCAQHHRCVHEGGWKLEIIGNSRGLRVQEPGRNASTTSLPESVRIHQ